jgi:hypothetical protein
MKMMEFIKIATLVSASLFGIGLLFSFAATYFSPLGFLLFLCIIVGIIAAGCSTYS